MSLNVVSLPGYRQYMYCLEQFYGNIIYKVREEKIIICVKLTHLKYSTNYLDLTQWN